MLILNEKIYLVKTYYSVNCDYARLKAMFMEEFKKSAPQTVVINRLISNFETTGNVSCVRTIQRKVPGANVKIVGNHFADHPGTSVRKASTSLNLSKSSIHKILRKNLKLKPYKTKTVQLLTIRAKAKRLHFANTFDVATLNNIWFSDESYFYLYPEASRNKFVWSKTKPVNNFVEKPSHSAKVLVWMAVSSHGVFWRLIEGNVNTESYVKLLKNDFFPYLKERNLINSCIFMQDGAPAHTSKEAFELIHEHFKDRVISTRYPDKYNMGSEWPPYSPDLTPMDYSIWGTLKEKVSNHGSKTIIDLKQAIREEVALFSQESIKKAIGDMVPRIECLKKALGGHIEL